MSTVDKTPASWMKITKDVKSDVDGQLDSILSLSYTNLPHHLRPCFLFMASFPEDQKINVSRLVKLWVAEGFLKHENGYKTMEEEAEEYLEDLVKRNLVLITSRKSNGKIKSCGLHDLVREMCIRKAQEEKFLVLPGMAIEGRCISLPRFWVPEIQGLSLTTHTFLSFRTVLNSYVLAFLLKFRLLRVLEIMHDKSSPVPLEVFELFHLRYLALAFTDIPAAISNLENLQTLIILPCNKSRSKKPLSYLPLEIWGLPRLRNLLVTECHVLPDPVNGPTFLLQSLQTLEGVPSCICSNRILAMFPNLKKLVTFDDSYGVNSGLHNYANLHQLEKLKITTSSRRSWPSRYPSFPFSLKKLTLVGGRFPWEVMSICGSLPNLEVLKLKDDACEGTLWETRDGEFPQLKFLLIEGSELQYWITESDHFPRLKCLILHKCSYLTEIPDCIGEIPTLEIIKVDNLNESLLNSAKQIQEDQLSYGNDVLQLQIKYCRTRQLSILEESLSVLDRLFGKEQTQVFVGRSRLQYINLRKELACMMEEIDLAFVGRRHLQNLQEELACKMEDMNLVFDGFIQAFLGSRQLPYINLQEEHACMMEEIDLAFDGGSLYRYIDLLQKPVSEERNSASQEIEAIRLDWERESTNEKKRQKAWRSKNSKQTGLKSMQLNDKFMRRSNRAHT